MRNELKSTLGIRHWAFVNRGSALIEFAITAPLFFLLVVAVFDFSFLLYSQLTLQSAVSEGARFGITGRRLPDPERPTSLLTRGDSIRAVVDRFAIGLDRSRLDVAIEQLDGDRQPVPLEPEDHGGNHETLIVQAQYSYRMLLPSFLRESVTVDLYAKSAMRNERFAPIGR